MWMCNVCAFALTICNPHVKSGHIMWFLTWLRQELKYTGPWNNLSIHQHTVIQWSINCLLRDHISIACWTQGWNKKNKKSVCKEWMSSVLLPFYTCMSHQLYILHVVTALSLLMYRMQVEFFLNFSTLCDDQNLSVFKASRQMAYNC